jgi:hypothetical protein
MRLMFPAIVCSIFLFGASCTKPIVCTEEFRIVSLTVTGEPLTDYYTIRVSSGDTIRHTGVYQSGDNWYPVLTDDYHPHMQRKKEEYRFTGLRDGAIVVDEIFEISSDKCHIQQISGKSKVTS